VGTDCLPVKQEGKGKRLIQKRLSICRPKRNGKGRARRETKINVKQTGQPESQQRLRVSSVGTPSEVGEKASVLREALPLSPKPSHQQYCDATVSAKHWRPKLFTLTLIKSTYSLTRVSTTVLTAFCLGDSN